MPPLHEEDSKKRKRTNAAFSLLKGSVLCGCILSHVSVKEKKK